jgi:PAS domain S-box-containing protein
MRLQTRFAIAFVPILFAATAGTVWQASKAVHKIVIEEAAGRANGRLEELAAESVAGFEGRSESLLLPGMTAALVRENALYVIAIDPAGEILAHTNVTKKGGRYRDPLGVTVPTARPSYHEIQREGQPVLELSWPVNGKAGAAHDQAEELLLLNASADGALQNLGQLRMGIPLQRALQTERRIARELALLLLVTCGLLLGAVFLLLRGILLPVQRLVGAAEEIGLGRYGHTVPVPSATELGNLARSFNRMSVALTQTTVSKDFLDNILTHMIEPLIVLEPDGRIRMVNQAALQVLGRPADTFLGQPLDNVWPECQSALQQAQFDGSVQDREMKWVAPGGTAIPLLFSASVFRNKEDYLAGLIVVFKDMRERKKIEGEMVQSAKLSAVGKLASGVAHEINNPLGVILGFAESLLWDLKPEDPMHAPLRSIEREAVRCKNLVQALLTFSRVSKVEPEPLAINSAVEEALSLVQAQARVGNVRVVREFAPELPAVRGNRGQIQQIVINLANNALDAMHEQGTLTIGTRLLQEAMRSWVVLSVTDTGEGIPEEIVTRIFEPFFTTKPVGQGTGLGLGLVHEIVEKHGGTIEVESRPGFTQFRVKLPA